jgi:hypothetical protein
MKPAALRALALAAILIAGAAHAADVLKVIKSPTCHCCTRWVEHMQENGFAVEAQNMGNAQIMQEKLKLGLKPKLASCHTGQIAGYVIEGHVPAREVKRLLAERPDAIGLTVPDMPVGSPGMETGGRSDPYDVLLVKRDGSTEVFASYKGDAQ